MRIIKIILILFLTVILTGCWNYRELNDMSIVGALGIDYDEEAKEFVISAQIFNPKKSSSGSGSVGVAEESPIIVYKYQDKTIHESLRNMLYESPKKLYIGHLDAVIFGKTAAEKYLKKSLDFLFRDAESRKDFDLLVAPEGTAYDMLQIVTPFETIGSSNFMSTVQANSQYVGTSSSVTFDNFISSLYQNGQEGVLPTIEILRGSVEEGKNTGNISDSVSPTDIIIQKLAVFKGTTMIGVLTEEESLGFNIITNLMKQSVISYSCDDEDGYASIELNKLKNKFKIELDSDKPRATMEITGKAVFSELNCAIDINLTKKGEKGLKKLTKLAENRLKELVVLALKASQEKYNSDILGFGEYMYRNENKYWEKVKDNWYEIFPKIETEIKVKLEIPQKGSVINTYEEKLNDTKKQ